MFPLTAGLIVETKELWEELKAALDSLAIRVAFEAPQIPDDWMPFLERIDRIRPDVILLELTRLNEPLDVVVKRIRATSAQPAVFALHSNAQPDLILSALRAGVSEFLYPPIAEPLKQALERLAEVRQKETEKVVRGGKAIGFLSAKGGCGATNVACHVARALAHMNAGKVLLADVDLQAGMIGFLLKTNSEYSMADAVNNLQRLDFSYWQGLVTNGTPNLEVITAPTAPAAKQLPIAHLKQVLAFARTHYDWSVLDLGRNVTAGTLSLLDVVDETYLVATPDIPALHQTKQIIQILLDAGYSRSQLRLILNRATRRTDFTIEDLEKMVGIPVHSTIVNDFDAFYEAYSEGRLVEGSSGPGEDFTRLAAKIAGVAEPARKKRFSLFG